MAATVKAHDLSCDQPCSKTTEHAAVFLVEHVAGGGALRRVHLLEGCRDNAKEGGGSQVAGLEPAGQSDVVNSKSRKDCFHNDGLGDL